MFLILTSSESESVVNYKYFIFVTEYVKIHLSYNKVTNLMKYNPRHSLHDIAMTLSPNKGIG